MTDKQIGVHSNTWILTKKYGQIHIGQLIGETVECWNGEEWSKTTIYQTNNPVKLKFITFSHWYKIYAGIENEWPVVEYYNSGEAKPEPISVRTSELEIGDRFFHNKIGALCDHGDKEFKYAYENGYNTGDGTELGKSNRRNRDLLHPIARIRFYTDDKKAVIPKFYRGLDTDPTSREYLNKTRSDREGSSFIELYYDISKTRIVFKPKYVVPEIIYSIKSQIEWLAGYFDADGSFSDSQTTLRCNTVNFPFLQKISRMLNSLGIDSRITLDRHAGKQLMPRYKDNKLDHYSEINRKARFSLTIPKQGIKILYDLGYNNYAGRVRIPEEFINNWEPKSKVKASKKFTEVVDIRDSSLSIKTCFGIEPKRHMLVYNGVLSYDGEI